MKTTMTMVMAIGAISMFILDEPLNALLSEKDSSNLHLVRGGGRGGGKGHGGGHRAGRGHGGGGHHRGHRGGGHHHGVQRHGGHHHGAHGGYHHGHRGYGYGALGVGVGLAIGHDIRGSQCYGHTNPDGSFVCSCYNGYNDINGNFVCRD